MKNVYEYDDFVDYLNDRLAEIKKNRPRYSLRSWSRKLGFSAPGPMSRILTRKREPTLDHVKRIAKALEATPEETTYMECLVQFNKKKFPHSYLKIQAALKPSESVSLNKLQLDQFSAIAEWYHVAILETLCLNKKFAYPADFKAVLNPSPTLAQIQKALQSLENLGLIKKENGYYLRTKGELNFLQPEQVSVAVTQYHHEMLGLAQEALKKTPRDKRNIQGLTFSVKKEDYQKAERIINKAYEEVFKICETSDGDDVYHFSTSLFPLSNTQHASVSPGR